MLDQEKRRPSNYIIAHTLQVHQDQICHLEYPKHARPHAAKEINTTTEAGSLHPLDSTSKEAIGFDTIMTS